MPDINDTINKRHEEVEAVENEARQIEARILKINGTSRFIPVRGYGKPVDPQEIARNLTLRSLIAKHDEALANYLGIGSAQHREAQEAAEARHLQAEALKMRTERLRQENQAAAIHRERAFGAGVNPFTGRRMGQ